MSPITRDRSVGTPSPFTYDANPARIVFGPGTVARLGDEVERLGKRRAFVVTTPFQKPDAERLAERLDSLAAGVFADAAMHTPVDVTEKAMAAYRATGADCVVALGGGSAIGLGKAIAYRNDAPQIAVATTYAGSEATPILGQTENGLKTTVRDRRVLPETVVYDPELTLGLPTAMSVVSGLNAMAHAIEGLYAEDRNPISSLMAVEALRALKSALPAIVTDPGDRAARGTALYGSWLCGTVLGAVGMALHHKICHTLGGSFDLPHAETHAVLLPYTVAYNAGCAATELKPVADLFGGDVGGALKGFAAALGAPSSLREIGLGEADLARAAQIASRNPYPNPRPIVETAIHAMLRDAWDGAAPS